MPPRRRRCRRRRLSTGPLPLSPRGIRPPRSIRSSPSSCWRLCVVGGRRWARGVTVEERGDPVLRPPPTVPSGLRAPTPEATLSSTGRAAGRLGATLSCAGRPSTRGDPALRRLQVSRHHLLLTGGVSPALHPLTTDPPPRREREINTAPRRRRPKQLRVTLSPSTGQLIRRPPASGRDQPGTNLPRSHHGRGIHLTTGAYRSRYWNPSDGRR